MPAVAVEKPSPGASVQMTYLEAIVQAQIEEMARDDRVILMGEDIAILRRRQNR
jgi:acetoin:2,6-dichlorophenolindophenol oxidoreductase subunit beta